MTSPKLYLPRHRGANERESEQNNRNRDFVSRSQSITQSVSTYQKKSRLQTIDLWIEQLQNKQIKMGSSRVHSKNIHMFYAVYIQFAAKKRIWKLQNKNAHT